MQNKLKVNFKFSMDLLVMDSKPKVFEIQAFIFIYLIIYDFQ
jgi:hypothetical protein